MASSGGLRVSEIMCSPAMGRLWALVDRWAGARSVVDWLPGDPLVGVVVCWSAAGRVSGLGWDAAYLSGRRESASAAEGLWARPAFLWAARCL